MAGRKKSKSATKRLSEISAEKFMQEGFSSDDEDGDEASTQKPFRSKVLKSDFKPQRIEKQINEEEDDAFDGDELQSHKRDLQKLQETDPDFINYLKENDKSLLDFDISDLSEDESETEPDLHKVDADTKLEVASDDSENEDDESTVTEKTSKGRRLVTNSMINRWTEALKGNANLQVVQDVVEVFAAAVEQAQGLQTESQCQYKVDSSITFNSVMRMCIVYLPNVLKSLLKISENMKNDNTVSFAHCKRWPKMQVVVKKYLSHLLKVLTVVTEPEIVSVLLKHVFQMVPFITATNRHAKGFLKRLIILWSSSEESVRVIAFLAIVNITRALEDVFHEFVLKTMYMSYLKNVKFTSPSTWPVINFMKRCLVEIFALNERLAYQYGFVYIRQLAIHLRNAITVKKKDSIATVYNWQYVHSLGFWSQLLSSLNHVKLLQPLVYPLVQTIIGTIKLVPTVKYFPLRFHCIRNLTNLTKNTGYFIPVLPLIIQVLTATDFNGKSPKMVWKPMDFICMLKLSKSQLTETGFKNSLLDNFYEVLMDYLTVVSHKVGFPELVLPSVLQMKSFLKSCQFGNYCKPVKTLLEKIEENSRYIKEQRNLINIKLSDNKAIEAWETQQKIKETPLGKYYVNYRKLRDREVLHGISKKDQMEDTKMPTINRQELMAKHKAKDKQDFSQLFSEDLNDSDNEFFSKKDVNSDDDCKDMSSIGSSDDDHE